MLPHLIVLMWLSTTLAVDEHSSSLQIQNIQEQVLVLQGALDSVILEYANLRKQHVVLERKFVRLSDDFKEIRIDIRVSFDESLERFNDGAILGEKGSDGKADFVGVPGQKGNKGMKGQRGDVGPLGLAGQKGDIGPVGMAGQKGEQGIIRTGEKAAFTARTSINKDISISQKIIIFDKVETNEGSYYDAISGVFTCGVNGTYLFTWSLEVALRSYVYSAIEVNGFPRMYLAISGTDVNQNIGTQTIVLQLEVGDRVYVREKHHDVGSVITANSSFTGIRFY
ncbi:otolin-1-like [Pecten maximus]|uniref:otolin-1-like n=1 Tax=Pecten maximus TaxID=6579 RepID=UPI0014580076|nr:otolin-1-like [Pecten maximus]